MKKIKWFFLFLLIPASGSFLFAHPPVEEGKKIFSARCAACHNINKVVVGPALAGIEQRRSVEWIISFIQSSQTMIKNGDTAAIAVFEKFNKMPMPDHPDLKDGEIRSIVEYIQSESKPVTEGAAPFTKPGKRKPEYLPLNSSNLLALFLFLAAVVVLIAVLYYAVHARQVYLYEPDSDDTTS